MVQIPFTSKKTLFLLAALIVAAHSSCTDLTDQDGAKYLDDNAKGCQWFVDWYDGCSQSTGEWRHDGYEVEMDAVTACCACGGGTGRLGSFTPPTPTPTAQPTPPPTAQCTDLPLVMNVHLDDCQYYENRYADCEWWENAQIACCACGGGTGRLVPFTPPTPPPTNCTDLTKPWPDVSPWADRHGYTCTHYHPPNSAGCDEDTTFPTTAAQACCACGGGTTPAPTALPTAACQCTDQPGYITTDGDTCTTGFNSTADCDENGPEVDVNGVRPWDACCICGGGTCVTSAPTADPTVDPTADPTVDPTVDPAADPTVDPTADPTADPTVHPTADPTPIATNTTCFDLKKAYRQSNCCNQTTTQAATFDNLNLTCGDLRSSYTGSECCSADLAKVASLNIQV